MISGARRDGSTPSSMAAPDARTEPQAGRAGTLTDAVPRRYDRAAARCSSLGDHRAQSPSAALTALASGLPLGRPLTEMERRALAVAMLSPRFHVTIDSPLERPDFVRQFGIAKKRIERDRYSPLVYVGVTRRGPWRWPLPRPPAHLDLLQDVPTASQDLQRARPHPQDPCHHARATVGADRSRLRVRPAGIGFR